jgi:hypothetical protein
VFETPPRVVPGGAKYRETIELGTTQLTQPEVDELLKRLSREYLGDRYHLLFRNVRLVWQLRSQLRLGGWRACKLRAARPEAERPCQGGGAHALPQCNHFCEELSVALTGRSPPGWVNRLAALARLLNTFAPCILPASVRALAKAPSMPALATAMADTMPLLGSPAVGTRATDRGVPTSLQGAAAARCSGPC